MDTQNSEISNKIRSAIKAKLVELGAYVDEELPDYVMVMIANKKSKTQMADDLNLFLGKNAASFSEWLFEVLDRLQSIAGKSKKPEEEKKKEEKFSKKPVVVAPEKPTEKDNKKESQKENKTEKRSDSQERSVTDRKRRHHRETKTKEEPKRSASPRPPSRNSKHPRIEAPPLPHGSRARKHADDEIQLDHNEIKDDLDFEIATAGAFQPGIVRKDPCLSRTVTAGVSLRKRIEPPVFSGRQRERKRARSPSPEAEVKQRKSVVAQIVQREQIPEEEYDPLNPQIGNMASVVRVTQRKITVPSSLQAKPGIFLRALNEANESAKLKRSMRAAEAESGATADRPMELRIRRRLPETSERRERRRDDQKAEKKEESEESDAEEEQRDKRLVSKSPKKSTDKERKSPRATSRRKRSKNDERDEEEERRLNEPHKPKDEKTRFVVTLGGQQRESIVEDTNHNTNNANDVEILVDDETEDRSNGIPTVAPIEILVDETGSGGDEEETPASGNAEKIMERCRFWPACKSGDECQYYHPTSRCKTFPNCRFGNKCLFIHPNCKYDAKCKNPACSYMHSNPRVGGFTAPAAPSFAPPKPKPKPVPCRHWNKCENLKCPYQHPKTCKYGSVCTRSDCIYWHPPKPSPKPIAHSEPAGSGSKFKWVAGQNAAAEESGAAEDHLFRTESVASG